MRITGGALRGRTIRCPDGTIRPAMDRMRESLFAILGDLDGRSFLDLFSGSGTVAIEAVSRGASHVELVEKDRVKVQTILDNVSLTEREMGRRIQCHFMAVELFIRRCRRAFDIIFLDPPFPYKYHQGLIELVAQGGILNPGGTALIHRPKERQMPDAIERLKLCDRREYGRSIVDFYCNRPE